LTRCAAPFWAPAWASCLLAAGRDLSLCDGAFNACVADLPAGFRDRLALASRVNAALRGRELSTDPCAHLPTHRPRPCRVAAHRRLSGQGRRSVAPRPQRTVVRRNAGGKRLVAGAQRGILRAMDPVSVAPEPATAPQSLRLLLNALSLKRVLLTLALAIVAAAALNPVFVTPFPIVLGRVLVIAMVLLLAFTLAGMWQSSWLPRWLAQVLAIFLVAPVATVAVYLPSAGGNVLDVLGHEGMVWGVLSITGTALLIAPVLALGALYRERDAQARNQQLQFELERSSFEKQALDARLQLLHAQVEPHFLFNTLANVQALLESGSPRAAPVLNNLIAYLRAAMPTLGEVQSTLGSEIRLVRAYLELMQTRMPDRLAFAIDIPPELCSVRFPSMALLTLVENAIRHGIDPSEQGGRIDVGARRDAGGAEVQVWVEDSGVGLHETAQPGTGLANLRARLAAFYGPSARLELLESASHGVRAQIVYVAALDA
jgi:signal transduction histidine kinase